MQWRRKAVNIQIARKQHPKRQQEPDTKTQRETIETGQDMWTQQTQPPEQSTSRETKNRQRQPKAAKKKKKPNFQTTKPTDMNQDAGMNAAIDPPKLR